MGFISKELTRKVAQRLDNLIKLKGIAEVVDGPVLRVAIDLFDETLGDNVPMEYRPEILAMLEAFADDDLSRITDSAADTINKIVDIPGVDEDVEKYWLAANLKMLCELIIYLSKRKRN